MSRALVLWCDGSSNGDPDNPWSGVGWVCSSSIVEGSSVLFRGTDTLEHHQSMVAEAWATHSGLFDLIQRGHRGRSALVINDCKPLVRRLHRRSPSRDDLGKVCRGIHQITAHLGLARYAWRPRNSHPHLTRADALANRARDTRRFRGIRWRPIDPQ